MQFRRSGQRDERRRRMLLDEPASSDGDTTERTRRKDRASDSAVSKSTTPKRTYTDEALARRQPRVTDLLPRRWWVLSIALLAAVSIVAGLNYLHLKLAGSQAAAAPSDFSTFRLGEPASLSGWFSSFLLLLAAGTSLQIFALRRHRVDDYRGCYRLWITVALVLLLASIDAATGLHRSVRGALVALTGATINADGSAWWLIVCGGVLAAVGLRLIIEIRRSKLATFALVLAAFGLLVPMLIQFGIITPRDATASLLVSANAVLLAHVAVLFSVTFYARYVYLDAQGKLPIRATRSAAKSQAPADADDKPKGRRPWAGSTLDDPPVETQADQEQSVPQPTVSRRSTNDHKTAATGESAIADSDDSDSPDDNPSAEDFAEEEPRRLSKAERRRLRKLQRRQRRTAA